MNKNPNLKLIGFFGQSGAGKTTIIRNVKQSNNGYNIIPSTGIIRYLFGKNPRSYSSPNDILNRYGRDLDELKPLERNAKIDEMYEKYIRSQMQLLNDFSSEVFNQFREIYPSKTIILFDRSPVDFYAITACGVNYLKSILKNDLNPICLKLLDICKKTAETNTQNLFDVICVTYPWKKSELSTLNDGVRDHYLSEFYVGDNWYNVINSINLGNVETFPIEGDITELMQRAKVVDNFITKIK
jgi:hypothetical protein